MPSRDPETGKRLSGAALRKRRREREGEVGLVRAEPSAAIAAPAEIPVPEVFTALTPPPAKDVAAVEAWAAGLNLRAAVGLETADEAEAVRLVAVVTMVRELGRLSAKARRSEKALELRRLRLGEDVELDPTAPPFDDPAAIVLWAFLRLAQLAYDAAIAPTWQPDGRLAAVKALASAGFVACNDELRRIINAAKAA